MKDQGKQRSPIVHLRGISKEFPTPEGRVKVLDHIDLKIEEGEFFAVVGKSGSGKSTLLNMITGIDRPTAGTALVDSTPVHALSEGRLAEWRGRTVGIVFQFFQLLPTLTIIENVMLPMDFVRRIPVKERRKRALFLLNRVGIAEQADKLPASLSGGQQQRAAIARALANDPPLLVADEPTGNLDASTAAEVIGLFAEQASAGKTVVIVTHEHDVTAFAGRAIMLNDGRIESEQSGTGPSKDSVASTQIRLALS